MCLWIIWDVLTWSILQERINTKPYGDNNEYFKAPIIINLIQALFASIIGFIYNYVTTTTTSTKPQPKPKPKPIVIHFDIFTNGNKIVMF